MAGTVASLRCVRLGTCAGLLAAPLLVTVFVGLTIAQLSFLRSIGWSAVHRTPVEWPSVLALGPHGWVEQLAFVLAGVLSLTFATTLVALVPTVPAKVGAALTGLASVGVMLMAFEPDHPRSVTRSWHDAIHDGAYPAIPAAALAAAAALAWGLRRSSGWRVAARVSASVFVVALTAIGLTAIDAIAQVARYFLFASLLVWLEVLALVAWRRAAVPPAAAPEASSRLGAARESL